MMNIEYSDENKIKIVPKEDEVSKDDREALKAAGKNPLAEEEAIEEDCRGHE